MKDEFQTEELSLADIFRTLLQKIKLLILVLLAGVVVGGSFGFITTMNTHYYGTDIQFYVNPKEKADNSNESTYGVYGAYGINVMDNMIKLLESESFTERLILGGAALPPKGASDEVDGLIDTALAKYEACKTPLALITEKEDAYKAADKAWNEAWAAYVKDMKTNYDTEVGSFSEEKCLENGYTVDVKNTYVARQEAKEAITDAEEEYADAFAVYKAAKEDALFAWRKLDSYKKLHEKISKSVSYSYLSAKEDVSNAANLARSFIYVEISVLGDKAFAETLLQALRKEIVAFVSEKMIVPSGYVGTSCEETTTRSMIELTNGGYAVKTAFLYAVLLGFLAVAIAAVTVIILDRSDKRLRDYDAVSKKLNIPVIGVIPKFEREDEQEGGLAQ